VTPDAHRPRLSTSALHRLLQCERRLWLGEHRREESAGQDEHDELLRARGRELEARVAAGIPGLVGPVYRSGLAFRDAADATAEHLRAGRPVWQAALRSPDGQRTGVADFVFPAEGGWVVHEAKLSHRPERRADVQLQLSHHAALVEELTGLPVVRIEVTNGLGASRALPRWSPGQYRDTMARAERVLAGTEEPTVLLAHSVCRDCPFYHHCWDRAEREGRVEVLSEVDRHAAQALRARGITTIAQAAALDPATLHEEALRPRAQRLVAEARAHRDQRAVWLADPQLPADRTRVWFDLEGDASGTPAEIPIYLWGLAVEDEAPEAHFADFAPGGDRVGWERFLARFAALMDAGHDLLLVHWHAYERQWVDFYLGRYGAPDALAARLRQPRLWFDLHRTVERCVRLPLRSYSIKSVAPWMGFDWRDPESGSEWSIAQFHRARTTDDPDERRERLAAIADYNADDLLAMRAVWNWMLADRAS
jgi:uncharacterized protein